METDIQTESAVVETPAVEVSTPEVTTPEVSTPAKEQSLDSQSSPKEGVLDSQSLPKEQPAYVPNYKVKAYHEEFEIPELFRGLMTKETEEQVRKVFEKAYAVDVLMPKYQKQKAEFETERTGFQTTQKEYSGLKKNLDHLGKLMEIGDFDTFFKHIALPEEKIQQWMLQKLRAAELPVEQRVAYDQSIEAKRRALQAEMEKDQLQESLNQERETLTQYHVERRENELNLVLSRPDVAEVAKAFNARVGRPDAFRDEVVKRGASAYQLTKQDLSAEDAVKEVLGLIGGRSAQATTPTQAASPSKPGQGEKPPVIPYVEGRPTSPAKKMPTSTSDLRTIYREKYQTE